MGNLRSNALYKRQQESPFIDMNHICNGTKIKNIQYNLHIIVKTRQFISSIDEKGVGSAGVVYIMHHGSYKGCSIVHFI